MFTSKHTNNYVMLLVLISFICLSNARQIRYNRYTTEVIEDSRDRVNDNHAVENESEKEIEATVHEITPEPYPTTGNRSMRAYPLSSSKLAGEKQSDLEDQVTDKTLNTATTEIVNFITTTQEYKSDTTTISNKVEENDKKKETEPEPEGLSTEDYKPKAPYPAAGFKPKIPFILPTYNLLRKQTNEKQNNCTQDLTEQPTDNITETPNEVEIKAPYPAAGYRPSKAFLLPSEQLQLKNDENEKEEIKPQMDNSNHPPCGSSTNPLAPKPLDDKMEDPNSESIYTNTQVKKNTAVIIPIRYSVHSLLPTRPLLYSIRPLSVW